MFLNLLMAVIGLHIYDLATNGFAAIFGAVLVMYAVVSGRDD